MKVSAFLKKEWINVRLLLDSLLHKKIFIKLKGGLGNQMFQYATARGVSKNSGAVIIDPYYIDTFTQSSDRHTARSFELNVFTNLNYAFARTFQVKVFNDENFQYKVLRKLFFLNARRITQMENEFIDHLQDISSSVYLEGYFQSEKYFKHIREDLLSEFVFPQVSDPDNIALLSKMNASFGSVSLHVRRGDYLKENMVKYHGVLPLSYYAKAIDIINSAVSDPHFYVFSDDPEWCRMQFSFLDNRYTVINHNGGSNSWKDMYLMSQCRHHIVANSSFSWWGAWLSQKQSGIKLAPYKWLNPEFALFELADIIPSDWQVVYYA